VTERRCDSCGASAKADAPWCLQCFARFPDVEVAGGPATGAVLGFAGPGTHATTGRSLHDDDIGGQGGAVATATLPVDTSEADPSVQDVARVPAASLTTSATTDDEATDEATGAERAEPDDGHEGGSDGRDGDASPTASVLCPVCSAQVAAGETSCGTCGQPLLAEPDPSVTGVAILDRFIALPRGQQYAIVAGIVAGVLIAVVAVAYLGALAGF
jgi:hypothetical protein